MGYFIVPPPIAMRIYVGSCPKEKFVSPQILSILVFVYSHGGPSYDYGTVGLFFHHIAAVHE